MDPKDLIKIRVARNQINNFPFDVFYLVPMQRRDVLPKLFPWSLCVPMTTEVILLVTALKVHKREERPHGQDRIKDTLWEPKAIRLTSIEHNLAYTFMVVPILPLTTPRKPDPAKKQEAKRLPGYLLAKRHRAMRVENDTHKGAFQTVINDAVVLFTPDGPVRPVCLKCPRHLLHVQGKCELGSRPCYEELVLKRSPYEQLPTDNADHVPNTEPPVSG